MRNKIFFAIVILAVCFQLTWAETKRIPLPEINNPGDQVLLNDSQIYFTEGIHVYIYSLKDFKLVKKIGKDGEGPQEFKLNPGTPLLIDVTGEHLVVNSTGKLSWWTKKGEFIKEMKIGFFFLAVGVFNNNFVASRFQPVNGELWRRLVILDKDMKEVKEIAKLKHFFQQGKGLAVMKNNPTRVVYDGKLFVAWDNDFIIDVYDSKLNKIRTIKLNEPAIKVTEKDKKDIIDTLKSDPQTRDVFPFLKPITFPDEYPKISAMSVSDNKIYVGTFKTTEERKKSEYLILDLKGKVLERVMFPVKLNTPIKPYPLNIHKGHVYQIVEDEENEEWVLEITKIGK